MLDRTFSTSNDKLKLILSFIFRYVPSNYVKKEKKSLLDKIIPRKLQQINNSLDFKNHHSTPQLMPPPQPATLTSPNNSNKNENLNIVGKALVKHKYTASKSDELTLSVGSRVNILEKFGDGWWKVMDPAQKIIGLYPSNYLQEENASVSTSTSNSSITPSSKTEAKTTTCNNLSPKAGANTSHDGNVLDSSYAKCESISSNEKELEYLRVIYPHQARNLNHDGSIKTSLNELTVYYNEIVRLVEDDHECLDSDKSLIKVFNSQGVTGMIPSNCVEPILDSQLSNFVFVRRPTCVGLFANRNWYFGNITRFETILLLNKYGKNGDYLVRDSDVSWRV